MTLYLDVIHTNSTLYSGSQFRNNNPFIRFWKQQKSAQCHHMWLHWCGWLWGETGRSAEIKLIICKVMTMLPPCLLLSATETRCWKDPAQKIVTYLCHPVKIETESFYTNHSEEWVCPYSVTSGNDTFMEIFYKCFIFCCRRGWVLASGSVLEQDWQAHWEEMCISLYSFPEFLWNGNICRSIFWQIISRASRKHSTVPQREAFSLEAHLNYWAHRSLLNAIGLKFTKYFLIEGVSSNFYGNVRISNHQRMLILETMMFLSKMNYLEN